MTITTLDIAEITRVHLGRPSPENVRLSDILIKLSSIAADYRQWIKLADQWHFYEKVEFTIPANTNDFALQNVVSNFSQGLSLEWIDPYRPTLPGLEVPLVNPGELDSAVVPYWYVRGGASDLTYPQDVARAAAIYGSAAQGTLKLRLKPTPIQESFRYRFFYTPINFAVTAPDEDLQFPDEFFYLLGYRSALELLPNCRYSMDGGNGQPSYNQFRQTISRGLDRAEESFNKWRMKNHQQNSSVSRPFTSGGRRF